jgi:hypothetical protein
MNRHGHVGSLRTAQRRFTLPPDSINAANMSSHPDDMASTTDEALVSCSPYIGAQIGLRIADLIEGTRPEERMADSCNKTMKNSAFGVKPNLNNLPISDQHCVVKGYTAVVRRTHREDVLSVI